LASGKKVNTLEKDNNQNFFGLSSQAKIISHISSLSSNQSFETEATENLL
jgi:hypothetical protein